MKKKKLTVINLQIKKFALLLLAWKYINFNIFSYFRLSVVGPNKGHIATVILKT